MASQGQWSTEKINEILAKYNAIGQLPKHNPFYMGDVNEREGNINFSYTKDELLEMARCKIDIMNFGENHAKVMTDDGISKVKMRKYQQKVLLQFKKYRFNVFLASRQIGKCVTFDTLVEVLQDSIYIKIPIYKLYFSTKINKTFVDSALEFVYDVMYALKGQITKLEAK